MSSRNRDRALLAAHQASECGKAWRLWAATGDRPDIQAVIEEAIREHLAHADEYLALVRRWPTAMREQYTAQVSARIEAVRAELDGIPYAEEE